MAYDKGESAGNILHKGWLKTRESENFAPNTIIDSVYAMDGTPYDDVVKGYIKDVASGEEITNIQQDIANLKTADTTNLAAAKKYTEDYVAAAHNNVNLDDSDVFYVVDGNGNIIFQADKDGAHSIDMYAGDVSLLGLNYKMSAISTMDDNEAFYITDKGGNVIARIDSTGVNSINFTSYSDETTEIANLNDVKAQVDRVEGEYKTADATNLATAKKYTEDYVASAHSQVNLDESDTFSIVDGSGNIAFMVDTDAVSKGINFITYEKDAGNYLEVANLNNLKITSDTHTSQITGIQQDITNKNNVIDERIQILEEKTGYMNAIDETSSTTSFNNNVSIANELSVNKIRMEDDTFYFTDGVSPANIIAKIDADGITTTKVTADLNGNAESANKVNNKLTLTIGTDSIEYDGSAAKAATVGDATVAIEAGSGLTKGGSFTTNQTSDSTITLDVNPGEGIEIKDDKVTLKVATSSTLGGIKQGDDISAITNDGLVTVNGLSDLKTKTQNITATETLTTFDDNVKISGELDTNTLKLQSDTYNFIDSSNKVIASIDKDGITSTQFNGKLVGNADTADKVNNSLTFNNGTSNSATYDGSSAVTINAASLGLSRTIFATATDDDIVILTGAEGTNGVSYDAKHAKKGPTSIGSTTGTDIKGSGASGTVTIPRITVDEYGHVTAVSNENFEVEMPTLPTVNNGKLTVTAGKGLTGDISFTANQSNETKVTLDLNVATANEIGGIIDSNEGDIDIDSTTGKVTISNIQRDLNVAGRLTVNQLALQDDIYYFTDSNGNVIAQIDADGLLTTRVRCENTKITNALDCVLMNVESSMSLNI